MRKILFSLSALAVFTLTACQSRPMMIPGYQATPNRLASQFQSFARTPQDLVGVVGFMSGDRLKVTGPFFTKGKGKVHNLAPDTFRIEFEIAGHHLITDATRLDESKVKFITIDLKAGRTVEAMGSYQRTGNNTVFQMPPGTEVEKLTVRGIKAGNFEADVVQPGKGSNTLKFFKE